jgi:hypothetical protein
LSTICQLSVVICVCKNKLSAILQKQILQNQFCKIAKNKMFATVYARNLTV